MICTHSIENKYQHDFRTILGRVKLTIVIDNASKSSRSVRSLASRKATQVAPEEASHAAANLTVHVV